MSQIILLRGVSGSGKSRQAQEFRAHEDDIVVSTDDYFTDEYGVYNFEYSELGMAHGSTRQRVLAAMEADIDTIVVDNTNTRWWEMMPYLEMAKKHSYDVRTVMVGSLKPEALEEYAERSKHGIPLEIIQRQAEHFEKLMDPKMGYVLEKLRAEIADVLKNG